MNEAADTPMSRATAAASGASPLPIRVTGGGPVALAFALFADRLMGRHVSIAFDERTLADARAGAQPPEPVASRPLAIAHGTRLLIERVARFPAEAAPIRRIDIALSGLPGRTRLSADEAGLDALGWVVRYRPLWAALRAAAAPLLMAGDAGDAAPAATIGSAPGFSESPAGSGPVYGKIDSVPDFAEPGGGKIDSVPDFSAAPIHVIADGDPGEDADVLLHGQSAVLAELTASAGPPGAAVERFTPDGPLALLPLPAVAGTPRWALVWCADTALAEERAAMPVPVFERALQAAFGDAFGQLALASARVAAPLARRARRRVASERTVWIGNAAQTLHPVAGQGLNMGIRDAHELADTLARAVQRGASAEAALAEYAQRRAADRATMLHVTDGLARGLRGPLLRPLQSVALTVLDGIAPLRGAVARGFMHGWPRA